MEDKSQRVISIGTGNTFDEVIVTKMLSKLGKEKSGLYMRKPVHTKSRASNMLNSEMLLTGVSSPKLRHG